MRLAQELADASEMLMNEFGELVTMHDMLSSKRCMFLTQENVTCVYGRPTRTRGRGSVAPDVLARERTSFLTAE